MRKFILLALSTIASVVLTSCGGSSGSTPSSTGQAPPEAPLPAFSVFPSTEVLGPSGTRFFESGVAVTWSVQEGAAGGAITPDGLYTAPGSAGVFHVVATSVQDPSRNAVARVTVASSGIFSPMGSMSTAREGHTATLLMDGRVLISGGNTCFSEDWCPTDSAEIFDASTGTSAITGKMSSARYLHTATLLNNGQVLMAGGGLATAEIYDLASGTFSATAGSMSVSRMYDTATLLADGKVLIAGGSTEGYSGVLASAEIYDPASGIFTPTGNMTTARTSHAATLLANGEVLIAGGWNDTDGMLATAELYDPATGRFTATGSMATARESHAAVSLGDSSALVVGGDDGWDISFSSAEVYDIASGTFTVAGSMMHGRAQPFTVTLPNGKVLVCGPDFSAELYDAASRTFVQTGSMATARWYPAATLLQDGRVLVFGGSNLKSVEVYQ